MQPCPGAERGSIPHALGGFAIMGRKRKNRFSFTPIFNNPGPAGVLFWHTFLWAMRRGVTRSMALQ
jgi:hypothetical protein